MNITRLALRRPVTTIMVFVCCVLMGGVASQFLPLEKFPDVEFPGMFINFPYPGSTPEEVERLITRPAEEVLGTISGIEEMNAQSSEDGAFIFMRFKWGADISVKSIEAREKLDGIQDQFPTDFERYFLNMFSTADQELLQFRISSQRDLSNAYEMLNRNLVRRLERLEGVGRVELFGVDPKEIRIELESDRLAAHKVDLNALFQSLQSANFSLTAGRVTDGGRRFVVRPLGEMRSAEEIAELLVGTGNLRLKDIASVTYGHPEREYARHLDGKFAVGLNVFKASGYNTVAVADRVKAEIEEIDQDPDMAGISLLTFEDQADSVVTSLIALIQSGLLGAVLSFFVLFFFLRQFTTTLIVSLAVPVSIMVTLVFLYAFGITLNVLSLMGLLLAVGMLVDNAVVITENIHRHQLEDSDVREATTTGVKEVALAVTAGTLTTAIVFLPAIVSPTDQISLFLKHVAIAISVSLAASLLIAQTVIPLLTSRLKAPRPKTHMIDRLVGRYGSFLGLTLRHRWWSALAVLLILVSVAIPMSLVEQDMFADEDGRRLELDYRINGHYTLERIEETVNKIEGYLLANKEAFEIEQVYTYFTGNYAETAIFLIEEDQATLSLDEVKETIQDGLPKVAIARPRFRSEEGGFGGAQEAITVSLAGESTQRLVELSREVERALEQLPGFTSVLSEAEADEEEIHVVVDRVRAQQYGFSTQNVAQAITTAMRGQNLRRIRDVDGEIDVRLMFQDADRQTMADLKNIPLVNPENGQRVTLASLADFRSQRAPQTIRRRNRVTIMSIRMDLASGMTMSEAQRQISAVMDHFALPAGYAWSFGQAFDFEQETQQTMLVNLLLALILIYLVMAALFESLITPAAIWTSILFAVVGVFWFFLLTGTVFSLMAMIGILVLTGIVVNNGIVLLDHVIKLRAEGLSRYEAIIEGGKERLRPILMTAGTTILGLLPLCFGTAQIGGDGPAYFPMARAIVGGLAFSTVITLLVLPTIYIWLDDLRGWSRKVVRG